MGCGRAFAILALLLLPLQLAAQSVEEQAKSEFLEAGQRFKQGDFEGALRGFRKAYDLVPRAKILLNIAAAYAELGRDADVANAYQTYIDHPDHDRSRGPQIRSLIANIDPRVGRIKLVVAPDGAVTVDNQSVGTGPLTLLYRVRPGRHVVTATFATGAVTRNVEVGKGTTKTVKLSAPPPPKEKPTEVGPVEETVIEEGPVEKPIYLKPWLWTGVGTAGAATAAIIFGLKAKGAESDYETLIASGMAEYRDAKSIEDRGNRHATRANIALAVTGAFAVATGVLIYLDVRDGGADEENTFTVVPTGDGGFFAVETWTW